MEHVLVSACLLGCRCRYDGESKPRADAIARLREVACVPLCPEQLGGLATPRPRQWLVGGDGHAVLDGHARVVNERGEDVTEQFVRGAEETLRLARLFGVELAYLKSKSPACGHGLVDIEGEWRDGDGVTTALLVRKGIRVLCVE